MSALRKPVNLSIDPDHLAKARELDVNISRAEEGLRAAVARAWKAENAEAIAGWNKWVEDNGIPGADLRLF